MLQVNSIYELMGKFNNEYKSLLDVIDNVIVVIDENYNLLYNNNSLYHKKNKILYITLSNLVKVSQIMPDELR